MITPHSFFSEKAALSIVPGQELKPSGYIEFLQKHQVGFFA